MSARDDVLAAVRAALAPSRDRGDGHGDGHGSNGGDGTASADSSAGLTAASTVDRGAMLDLFAERVADYRATVTRCAAADLARRDRRSALDGTASVVVPPGLGSRRPGRDRRRRADPHRARRRRRGGDPAAVGIAETGTVVLDHGPGQGRRVITLLPDLHVCVVHESQVVPDVPDALARLDPQRPQTWISGPSATSDIELSRVEGVHGPRRLHVVLVAD